MAKYFALDHSYGVDPRVSIAYQLSNRQVLHASASMSSQLAPLMDMISYTENQNLKPITVSRSQWGCACGRAAGERWTRMFTTSITSNEPVATEYSQLMLANMIDTLGQQFVWLPLKSAERWTRTELKWR